jgi:hypothetical protein
MSTAFDDSQSTVGILFGVPFNLLTIPAETVEFNRPNDIVGVFSHTAMEPRVMPPVWLINAGNAGT